MSRITMNTHHPSLSCPDFPGPSSSSSPPPPTPPASKSFMNPPGHSPHDIQTHLYNSFLEGKTVDVALRVHGSWDAVYHLHRVVLIQAGFFRSLFAGGFLESSPTLGGHHAGLEEMDITFADPNITRPAFEVCIAQLYGGGPPLHVDPGLIPSIREPLTVSFPMASVSNPTPAGHHPASPRFLLSLIATSVYLSIPSIVSQALLLVLGSVGPHTVVRYLSFAIGSGIGERCDNEPEAATGLEHIGLPVQPATHVAFRSSSSPLNSTVEDDEADMTRKLHEVNIIQKEHPSDNFGTESGSLVSDASLSDGDDEDARSFNYGPISDKIGEAAACWLTRWGSDILQYEESTDLLFDTPVKSRRRATVSAEPSAKTGMVKLSVPTLWARGGLNPVWVRTIISSDSFFIKNERERYNLACRVVELRRRSGILEREEREWDKLFADGIYYYHMSLDDLISIAEDVSPTTGRSYVPLAVLKSAHWAQSLLRQRITVRPSATSSNSPPGSPPPPRDRELGITVTTADILATNNPTTPKGRVDDKVYWSVPEDSSVRVGDSSGLEGASMDQLFEVPFQTKKGKLITSSSTSEANFFGIASSRRTASSCIAADNTGTVRWSPYAPYRFGVEFWGVEALKEKSRLYSQTVWYAGSLFNVYLQLVRKKGLQLGVYLHRQSSVDPIPLASAPPPQPMTRAERTLLTHGRSGSLPPAAEPLPTMPIPKSSSVLTISRPMSRNSTASASGPSRSTTPVSSPTSGSPLSSSALPSPTAPAQPYRDPRSSIVAHFTIVCASATGSSLTRFSSSPDAFPVGQSWGWKSSTLRADYVEGVTDGQEVLPSASKDVSLRATVILGVV